MQKHTSVACRRRPSRPRSASSSSSGRSRGDDAERALGARGLEALERDGARTRRQQTVEPRARIAPVGTLLLASDRLRPTRRATRPTTSPRTRRPHGSATCSRRARGSHARSTSARATASRRCSPRPQRARRRDRRQPARARLHGAERRAQRLDNVETRNGSLFEPVAGERFDLITCNAPFVVSPERRWTYRDGWLEGDELSEQVVRETAAHLADGGFATLLASWLGRNSTRRTSALGVGRRHRLRRVDPAGRRGVAARARGTLERAPRRRPRGVPRRDQPLGGVPARISGRGRDGGRDSAPPPRRAQHGAHRRGRRGSSSTRPTIRSGARSPHARRSTGTTCSTRGSSRSRRCA